MEINLIYNPFVYSLPRFKSRVTQLITVSLETVAANVAAFLAFLYSLTKCSTMKTAKLVHDVLNANKLLKPLGNLAV